MSIIRVCTDCMLVEEHPDELKNMAPERRKELWSLVDVPCTRSWEEEEGITAFSWSPCDACGSALGGSRYEYLIEDAPVVPISEQEDPNFTRWRRALQQAIIAGYQSVHDIPLVNVEHQCTELVQIRAKAQDVYAEENGSYHRDPDELPEVRASLTLSQREALDGDGEPFVPIIENGNVYFVTPEGTRLPLTIWVGWSSINAGLPIMQIDTEPELGKHEPIIRISLNDGDIHDGEVY